MTRLRVPGLPHPARSFLAASGAAFGVLVLVTGCVADESGPPKDRLGTQRPMLQQVTTDLGLPADLTPTDEEFGGSQCSLSGCPTLKWIYPQDTPYTITTCETWADTLEAAGYTIGAGYEGAPRISESMQSGGIEKSLQPRCSVRAQREGDDYVFRVAMQGLTDSASQWEIQAVWLYG